MLIENVEWPIGLRRLGQLLGFVNNHPAIVSSETAKAAINIGEDQRRFGKRIIRIPVEIKRSMEVVVRLVTVKELHR